MMILGAGLMVLMMVGMFVGHGFIMKHDDGHTKDSAHTAMTRDPAPGENGKAAPGAGEKMVSPALGPTEEEAVSDVKKSGEIFLIPPPGGSHDKSFQSP